MGRRGPKPKGEYPDQSAVFSTRIRPDLKAWLVAEVERKKNSGREASLAQEIERRLRRSMFEDEEAEAKFGSRELHGIFRLSVAAMRVVGEQAYVAKHGRAPKRTEWLGDAYAYNQSAKAVATILDSLRPPGDPAPPAVAPGAIVPGALPPNRVVGPEPSPDSLARMADAWNDAYRNIGVSVAKRFVQMLLEMPTAVPLPTEKLSSEEWLAYRIADWLRPLIEHLRDPNDPTPVKRRRKTEGGMR